MASQMLMVDSTSTKSMNGEDSEEPGPKVPMVFSIYPPGQHEFQESLVNAIEFGGGRIISYEDRESDEYTIILLKNSFLQPNLEDVNDIVPSDAYASAVIWNLLCYPEIGNINHYLWTESRYKQYDVNDILLRRKSWKQLQLVGDEDKDNYIPCTGIFFSKKDMARIVLMKRNNQETKDKIPTIEEVLPDPAVELGDENSQFNSDCELNDDDDIFFTDESVRKDDSESHRKVKTIQKLKKRKRTEYMAHHGQAILDFLLERRWIDKGHGTKIWKAIEENKWLETKLGPRSWSSLRSHWIRTIIPHLKQARGPTKYKISKTNLEIVNNVEVKESKSKKLKSKSLSFVR